MKSLLLSVSFVVTILVSIYAVVVAGFRYDGEHGDAAFKRGPNGSFALTGDVKSAFGREAASLRYADGKISYSNAGDVDFLQGIEDVHGDVDRAFDRLEFDLSKKK